jgi:hypothetical protein
VIPCPRTTVWLSTGALKLRAEANLVVAKELACDVMAWNKTFEDGRFVSIAHIIPC